MVMASDQTLQIPPGYRFEPTDEELIAYYLTKKAKGERIPWDIICDTEIYGDNEPWKIFGLASLETFYVFTKQKKKGNGVKRIDRIAGSGTWKDQRKDPVKDSKGNAIGFRRLLSFEVKGLDGSKHRGKGHWIMHEYSLLDDNQSYVLCSVRNKAGIADDQPPSKRMKTGHSVEDDRAAETIVPVTEVDDAYPEKSMNEFLSEIEYILNRDDGAAETIVPVTEFEGVNDRAAETIEESVDDLLGPKR